MTNPPPGGPAFGPVEPLGRRARAVVLAALATLLVLAFGIRASGVLRGDPPDPSLPPLPAAVVVLPGLVRGGQPQDLDLVRLRHDHGGYGLVDVDGMTVEEQAVARGLGLRTLQLTVPEGGAPTAAHLIALMDFVRSAGIGTDRVVYLHDATGKGAVVAVAAMLQLLRGVPLSTVLASAPAGGFSASQLLALRQVYGVVRNGAPATGPYAELRGVTW
jgi:hypothetical protein